MTRHELNEVFLHTSFLQGANATYLAQLHARYEQDPASLDPAWRAFFASLDDTKADILAEARGPSWAPSNGTALQPALPHGTLSEQQALAAARDTLGARMLIRAYRTRGHLAAKLDPLELVARREHPELKPKTYGFTKADYDRPIFIGGAFGLEFCTLRQMLGILKHTYSGHIGFEYMHISDPQQRAWIQDRIEGREISFTPEGKTAILKKLIEAESFERFLDVKYTGTKRFGLDGGESTVPALEQIIKRGGQLGLNEIVIGMPHRGRLNVLSNVMAKPYRAIFNEFKGGSAHPDEVEGSGDVKYHLGASSDREFDQNRVHLSLTANPSHLEIVDPVVLGKVRAKQDQRDDSERKEVLPLLLHGDAAFAGQGVVAECLGLSGLRGHRTGGSLHFIVNNQIGFTTAPRFSRSSPYPSDVAKMIDAPIFHVNGDDPEAVVHVAKIAIEYRQHFGKPVVIDMFCYRRHGHNEADEPAFTQPLMYARIREHPSVVEVYSQRLVDEGLLTRAEVDHMQASFRAYLEEEMAASDAYRPNRADWLDGKWSGIGHADEGARRGVTGVDLDVLKEVGRKITSFPKSFTPHKTIARIMAARRKMIDDGEGIDWSTAESLAYGTLLVEGFRVRLSGQDSERGTFSQRHAVLMDQVNEKKYTPLKHIAKGQAPFEVINSMLSEEAVLGFEYGYSLAEPNALVLWEAQFGDFANGAQVVVDQFISSGERKWLRMSGLVLLLPHGYEGQGPEHSSAQARALPPALRRRQLADRQLHHARQLFPHPQAPAPPRVPQASGAHDAEVAAPSQARGIVVGAVRPGVELPSSVVGRRPVSARSADQARSGRSDQARRAVLRQSLLRPLRRARKARGQRYLSSARRAALSLPGPRADPGARPLQGRGNGMVPGGAQKHGRLELHRAESGMGARPYRRQTQASALCRPAKLGGYRDRADEQAYARTQGISRRSAWLGDEAEAESHGD